MCYGTLCPPSWCLGESSGLTHYFLQEVVGIFALNWISKDCVTSWPVSPGFAAKWVMRRLFVFRHFWISDLWTRACGPVSPSQADVRNEPHPQKPAVLFLFCRKSLHQHLWSDQTESGTYMAVFWKQSCALGREAGMQMTTRSLCGRGWWWTGEACHQKSWLCPPSSPGSNWIPRGWLQALHPFVIPQDLQHSRHPKRALFPWRCLRKGEGLGEERDSALQGKIYTHCQFISI